MLACDGKTRLYEEGGYCGHGGRNFVYALLCQDENETSGYIKFGKTQNLGRRIRDLKTGCPLPAKYICFIECAGRGGADRIERSLHQTFSDRRSNGEWFRFDFSSQKDKKDFNEKCRAVFSGNDLCGEWWEKLSINGYFELVKALKKERRKDYKEARKADFLSRQSGRSVESEYKAMRVRQIQDYARRGGLA